MVCTTRYLLNAAITVGWVVLCPSVSLSAGRPGNLPLFGSPTTRSLDNPQTHIQQANVSTVIGVIFMRTETAAISFDNDCQHVVLVSLPPSPSLPPYISLFPILAKFAYSLWRSLWSF